MATSRQRRATAQEKTIVPKRAMTVSPEAVALSRTKPSEQRVAVDPFIPAVFPPSVSGSAQFALDEAPQADLSWAAQVYQSGAFSEGTAFLGYPYLASLAQRGEYRKIVETIATDMVRKWIRLVAKGEEDKTDRIKALEDALERFAVRDAFQKAAEYDGFFGRGHIHIALKGDDAGREMGTPIGSGRDAMSKAKIARGSLQRLQPVEPIWVGPNPINFNTSNPLAPDFYRPNNWNVMGRQVHESRLLTFVGREVPDVLKPAYGFGGLAMTQIAKPYVDNWLRTRQSVSDLIASFSVSGVSGMNLEDALSSGQIQNLLNRIEVFNNLRNNRGFMGLNTGEEFFNVSTPLGTLDKLQAQSQEQMASICGIPLVKLLGVSPAGLNASSDGEIRVYYDFIHAYDEHLFGRHLNRVLDLLMLNEFGEIDESIGYEFEPLWQMSDKEKAEVALARTQAVMTAEPVLAPQVVLRELREMADATGVFTQITDEDVEEAENAPPLPGETDADGSEPAALPDRPEDVPALLQAAE